MGYSLTGNTSEQVLFMLYGTGANGKSTTFEELRRVLVDYAQNADFISFLARDRSGASEDIARLKGSWFVTAIEAEAGKRLSEVLIK